MISIPSRLRHLCQRSVAVLSLFTAVATAGPAQAQSGYMVSVSPSGPIVLSPSGAQTLTATAVRPAFNLGGQGCGAGTITALAMQPDGKALIGGGFVRYNNDPATPHSLIRLNPDGRRDLTFNAGGSGIGGGIQGGDVMTVVVQPNGYILVGGNFSTYNGTPVPFGVMRLQPNGTLDPGFNPGGAGFSSTSNAGIYALALQADGKVLVGGSFTAYNGDAAVPDHLVRLNTDGQIDTTYNVDGSGFGATYNGVFALAIQPDGRILAGGWFYSYNNIIRNGILYQAFQVNNLVRLEADGSRDFSFNPAYRGFDGTVRALALQPNGNVLVAGDFTTYNTAPVSRGIVRLTPTGAVDAAFNAGGTGLTIPYVNPAMVNGVAVLPSGKVLLSGNFTAYNGGAISHHILRLNPDGSPDPAFNPQGTGFDTGAWHLAVQADGRIIVGGNFGQYNGAYVQQFLTRLTADGQLNDTPEPVAGATYRWSTGATTPSISVATAGTYSVTVTAGGFASQSALVTVTGGALATRPAAATLPATCYPNPAHGWVQVLLPTGAPAGLTAEVFNLLGQRVYRQQEPAMLPGATATLPVGHLPAGLYTLRLMAGALTSCQSLVLE
ncbi:MAG: hypothetical protein JWP58_1960 [Hymenobacter sp.]|nr:hypothetical protein [Hymenobacter sp.]